MKRIWLLRIADTLLAALLSSLISAPAFAQGARGELPPVKPTPTPTPRPGGNPRPSVKPPTPTPAPARVTPTLVFNKEVKDQIDPKSSEKLVTGGLYEEFILNARADDWLNFQLQSENADLVVQILDKDKAEMPVVRGGPNMFKVNSQTGGLPADGEYRLRVTSKVPAAFSLTVVRLGLTGNVFNERFNKIYSSIRESDPASINAAIADFEALAKEDGYRPMTFEQLGLMYLYNRRDFEKAEKAMEQAIKLNGAGVVKISFDSQWRRMRQRSGKTDWEDSRNGWLRIRPGQLVLTDPGNRPLATVNGAQIKELANISTANQHLVSITGMANRQFLFAPGTREQAEAALVVKLIQQHVMGKTN